MHIHRFLPLRYWLLLVCAVAVIFFSSSRIFEHYELISYDLRLKLRPHLPVSSDIILIEISDDTLHNLGRWPLPRDFHASLIQVLHEFGARLVVFDILFSEPTPHDENFAQSIAQAGTIYLPQAFYIPENPRSQREALPSREVLGPLCPVLKPAVAGTGHINVFIDPDGKIRRIPLFIRYQQGLFANIGFLAACQWLTLDPGGVVFENGSVTIGNKLRLPVGANTSFMVNYPDTWRRSFTHVSYFQILKAYYDFKNGQKPQFDLTSLRGKACFVGLTAAGTTDLRAMPLDNNYPMLGLQASVFNSVIQQKFIRDVGLWWNALVALFLFATSLFLSLKLSPVKAAIANGIMACVYFVFSTALFIIRGIWTDLFFPIAVVVLSYASVLVFKFIEEIHQRQLLEKELDIARSIQQSFLPKDVASFAGLSISASMQAAKFVAGDFYDIAPLDEHRLGVMIGDVSGKGASASLIMAQSISLFRIFARQYTQPGEVLSHLNRELCGRFPGRFVTALYMVVDTRVSNVSVASAAHAPLLVYKKTGGPVTEAKLDSGVPLGIMEDVVYGQTQFTYAPHDCIVLSTDGVFEARDSKAQEFGIERLKAVIAQSTGAGATSVLEHIKNAVRDFAKNCPQHDDITIIVVKADQ